MPDKARYFDFITYETDREKVKAILKAEGGDYLISPVHQPDSEQSKPHLHVMYRHGNTVTVKAAKKVIPADLPANGYVVAVAHPTNRQRYYLHLDDPEKQQFDGGARDLILVNNFPLDLTRELSAEERRQMSHKVLKFVRDNAITEYAELVDATERLDEDMFKYVETHTIFLSRYLDSVRYSAHPDDD